MRCSCGGVFRNEQEWKIHYLILQPHIHIANRLTKTTDAEAAESLARYEDHKVKHYLIKK